MDDDNIGKEGPEHFTEHGDEEGEDSDSGGSNVEEEHVRPYEHDPSFKSKEELEHFLKGCDNRIESESDSEDENVDYESWRGIRKLCHCEHFSQHFFHKKCLEKKGSLHLHYPRYFQYFHKKVPRKKSVCCIHTIPGALNIFKRIAWQKNFLTSALSQALSKCP